MKTARINGAAFLAANHVLTFYAIIKLMGKN